MIIDTDDSRFDFSDKYVLNNNFSTFEDEQVLENIETVRRNVGYYSALWQRLNDEAKERGYLIDPPVVDLEERGDNWLVDRRYEIKEALAEVNKQEEILKEERNEIDNELLRRFAERGTTGTKTDRFTVSVREDDNYPEVEDRTVFEEYVLDTGKLHLLQKRVALKALREELQVLEEEYATYLEELEENEWHDDACVHVLSQLDVPTTKIETMQQLGKLEELTKNELEEYYTIPGVNIVTKLTINQVKKGKK